jgi:hypothetical protein
MAVYNSANYDYPFLEDGTNHTFAQCFREYRNTHMPFLFKFVYQNRTLTVEVDTSGHGYEFQKCFTYSPIFLATGFYFGVSAMTGDYPDVHDLISIDVYEVNSGRVLNPKGSVPNHVHKLDEKTLKRHADFQQHLQDAIRRKEDEDFRNAPVDMVPQKAPKVVLLFTLLLPFRNSWKK